MSTPIIGRLAPSPTGALHLGNARSFLIAWLSARSQDGRMILRMEDLDHPKVKPGTIDQVYSDLRWLGLDWDEGPDRGGPHAPYTQSQRTATYRDHLQRLIDADQVYPCTCSRRDVEAAQSAPHIGEDGPRYPGTCQSRFNSFEEACESLPEDRLPAWRFRSPSQPVQFHDVLHGHQVQDVSETIGDFVLARHPDGAGYQLAVVVDDALMGVTEVIRGDDLLTTTHRQILLYEALGLTPPRFIHVPLIVGRDGRRLAKRHGDTRIAHIREAGMPAEQVVGYLASTCGWCEAGTSITPRALIQRFTLNTLPTSPTVVDKEALDFLGIHP
ncbi:MAG: tRNA glutamyl-Q(34) synthetase GluQRS [Planctomycetota bacterium]